MPLDHDRSPLLADGGGVVSRWQVTIEAWPHSTGDGAEADQEACGERSVTHVVGAEDIDHALRIANLIREGVLRNPRVWQAPIVAIVKVPHT